MPTATTKSSSTKTSKDGHQKHQRSRSPLSSNRRGACAIWLVVLFSIYVSVMLMMSLTRNQDNKAVADSGSFSAPPVSIFFSLTKALNLTESLNILLTEALNTTRPIFDNDIIPDQEAKRCSRYGFKYANRTSRRRIFAGGMIADDSFHTIGIHAMESYGIYTHVAFVESNRTHIYFERKMRFLPRSNNLALLQSGMFGPMTNVTVDYYMVDEMGNLTGDVSQSRGIFGQQVHRNEALHRWKKEGMRPDDLGIIMDADEFYTRDFLRALQICDVPEFRSGQTCEKPKILAKGIGFEGSPECIDGNKQFWHPDVIIGECIEGIGDSTKHIPAVRIFRDIGLRKKRRTRKNTTLFPLWNAADYRQLEGGRQIKGHGNTHTGFHIHNFVEHCDSLRFKYTTYGEPTQVHITAPLGKLHTNLDQLVKCSMERTQDHRRLKSIADKGGEVPLAFQLKSYVEARHREVKVVVERDEAKYGCHECTTKEPMESTRES